MNHKFIRIGSAAVRSDKIVYIRAKFFEKAPPEATEDLYIVVAQLDDGSLIHCTSPMSYDDADLAICSANFEIADSNRTQLERLAGWWKMRKYRSRRASNDRKKS